MQMQTFFSLEMKTSNLLNICRTCLKELQEKTISIYNCIETGLVNRTENFQTDIDQQLTVRIVDIILIIASNITVNCFDYSLINVWYAYNGKCFLVIWLNLTHLDYIGRWIIAAHMRWMLGKTTTFLWISSADWKMWSTFTVKWYCFFGDESQNFWWHRLYWLST